MCEECGRRPVSSSRKPPSNNSITLLVDSTEEMREDYGEHLLKVIRSLAINVIQGAVDIKMF